MEGNQRNEPGRAQASVSLSFDDGREDNAVLFSELLFPARIPMTLNISTGYLDGTCPAALLPTEKPPMSVEDVRRLSANPLVEIAAHGDAHLNTEEDILRGETKLRTWLHLEQSIPLGFASPNSGMDLSFFRSPAGEALRERVAYLRTGPRISSQKALRLFCRKVGRVIHLPLLYRIAYHDTIMTERDGKILYSVPVMGNTSVPQVLAVVRDCVKRRGALVLLFHSVEPSPAKADVWSWSEEKMTRLCDALLELQERGVLRVCTSAEQFRLLRERT